MKNFALGFIINILFSMLIMAQKPYPETAATPPAVLHAQGFEIMNDYQGKAYLVMNLIMSLDKGTTKIVIAQSTDEQNWQDFKTIAVENLRVGDSYQNIPLSINIAEIDEILQKNDDELHFAAFYYIQDTRYLLTNNLVISKQDIRVLENRFITMF